METNLERWCYLFSLPYTKKALFVYKRPESCRSYTRRPLFVYERPEFCGSYTWKVSIWYSLPHLQVPREIHLLV